MILAVDPRPLVRFIASLPSCVHVESFMGDVSILDRGAITRQGKALSWFGQIVRDNTTSDEGSLWKSAEQVARQHPTPEWLTDVTDSMCGIGQ
jgi:hypothetical protein